MALFNNKELESLQSENAKLKDKIESLETRLFAKDTALSEYRSKVEELEERIEQLTSKILDKAKNSKTYSSHRVEKVSQEYDRRISELKEEIAALQIKPRSHNERGAGRKHKATPEQKEYITSLFSQGISQNKIARMMTEQTGGKWNKTTVRNIIISENN